MRKRAVLFIILAALLMIPGIASAISIGSIGTGYVDFGDKRFSDFSISGAPIDPFDVYLGWSVDSDGVYLMDISSSAFATTSALDWTLKYSVTTLGSMTIAAIDQYFVFGASGTGGNVSLSESVYKLGFPGLGGELVAYSSLNWAFNDTTDPPAETVGDMLNIDQPLSQVWVVKDIRLIANVGGQVSATTIGQSFHQEQQVPEPMTLLLLGLGLFGLGIIRKLKK